MKFLFDIFPVLIFFIAFKVYGIMVATALAIAATFVQAGWSWYRRGKIEKMLLINLGIIVVFGGATLLLQDEWFIKWKPTVLYWAFAVVLAASELFLGKNLIRAMMSGQMTLPDPVWKRVNWSWAIPASPATTSATRPTSVISCRASAFTLSPAASISSRER